MLRTIDDADVRVRSVNYDESDDDDEGETDSRKEAENDAPIDYKMGLVLPVVDEDSSELDVTCDEVQEVLASTAPSASKKAKKGREVTQGVDGGDTSMDGDGDDEFELGSWV